MRVAIIDCRPERRLKLEAVALRATQQVTPVPFLGDEDISADLILLHVGADQEVDDDIEQLLERFHQRSWILMYYGGTPVSAAKACTSPNVAIFPASVDSIDPGVDFVRTVQKVLAKWPEKDNLPDGWLRDAVIGFDPVLEAKLDVLSAVLQGAKPSSSRLEALRQRGLHRGVFDVGGELILDRDRLMQSATRLRKLFFHENDWEHDLQ